MNQVNLNQMPSQHPSAFQPRPVRTKRSFWRIFLLLVLVLALVLGAAEGVRRYRMANTIQDPDGSGVYAVFLSNGQVYFGEMVSKNSEEIVLSKIYYLQPGTQPAGEGATQGTSFSIVKLGEELHGPTDKMFINMAQVLFYEQLRKDSKVVSSME